MKNFLLLLALSATLTACGHSINFRASHFAVPIVAEKQWGGHVALVGASNTNVTVINDVYSNPPTRTEVKVNEGLEVGDLVGINYIGFDASLSPLNGLDIYLENSMPGLRYQFLNHGAGAGNWVASISGAFGERNIDSVKEYDSSSTSGESKVKTSQAGISLGYKYSFLVPYLSYIYESHEVTSTVKNSHGTFGPYEDKGIHQYYTLGLTTHGTGFLFAIEYSAVNINWQRAQRPPYQSAVAAKLGFAW